MKVKKRTLLLIACLVWSAAGANILRIGIISYLPFVSLFHLLLSAAVFLLFDRMIFGRLVEKPCASCPTRKNGRCSCAFLMENPLPSWRA